MADELEPLRERIRDLDDSIQRLIVERLAVARQAGVVKRDRGLPIRDLAIERRVVASYRDAMARAGLPTEMGDLLARLITGHSVMLQENLPPPRSGIEGDCLIVGGSGGMGRWFTRFLTDLGWRVAVHDPRAPPPGVPVAPDLRAGADDADLVLVSVPPAATRAVLEHLRGVEAVVADLASIKAPFADLLPELARHQPITSLHPMWGPDARVLSGRNLLVADCGNADANAFARRVFEPTAVTVVDIPLEDHDRLMATVLNLPHLLALAFGAALRRQNLRTDQLIHLGGPTFAKAASVSAEVANENPELYRQIQALNPHGAAVAQLLHDALDDVRARVGDDKAFRELMEREARALEPFREVLP